jgi:hypothetical protein
MNRRLWNNLRLRCLLGDLALSAFADRLNPQLSRATEEPNRSGTTREMLSDPYGWAAQWAIAPDLILFLVPRCVWAERASDRDELAALIETVELAIPESPGKESFYQVRQRPRQG